MNTLFPIEPTWPDGFSYVEDFLTEDEEMHLYGLISKIELHPFIFQGFEAKRRVSSFGYDYNFDRKTIAKGKQIPTEFDPLIAKVSAHTNISQEEFSELLVTEYPIGSVINWHRDAFPFEVIVGISLMSDCVFKLRPYDKSKHGRGSVISVPVRRRSLYVIKGKARMEWEHSTAPVKNVRFSITLRTMKKKTEK